ncbi:hypothetical protein [Paenibacillus sp. H1-7]|nr:hypothetical protein [Paenibacillus sp. H1-7]
MVRDTQSMTDLHGFSIFTGIGTYYDNPYLLNYSFEEDGSR